MTPGRRPRSLQWRLLLSLLAAIALVGGLTAALSFAWALQDANEILDGGLQDAAFMVASGQMAVPRRESQLPRPEPEDDLLVIPLPAAGTQTGFGQALQPLADGLHTVWWQGREWRVLLSPAAQGERVAIAQRTEVRDEIARHSALRTLIPMLLLVPLLGLVVRVVVRRTLAPVSRLARHVNSHAIGPAARLPEVGAPQEIEPFLASIRRLLQELTERLEQQRRFVANAAHELRSPMAALRLQAGNVEQVVVGQEAQARVAQLRLGIERMQHLLEQLLAVSMSQVGGGACAPVRLAEVATQVLAECVLAAEAKGMDLGMDVCDRGLCVLGTQGDLAMLLRNVVGNALKYGPAGSVVSLSIERDAGEAVLTVDDEGPGLEDAHLARVFEAFYRVPGTCEPGSGLGLAIVDTIAKRLGGRATLRPRLNAPGLRFEYRQALAGASAAPPPASD